MYLFTARSAQWKQALEQDIVALLEQTNVAGPASLVIPAEYLEVVITKT